MMKRGTVVIFLPCSNIRETEIFYHEKYQMLRVKSSVTLITSLAYKFTIYVELFVS